MSGGKKKSGFQITSVTSDYEQQHREGLQSPPGTETKVPSSPRVVQAQGGPGEEEEGGGGKRTDGLAPPNGPQGPGPAGASAAASRFRVVKLDQSSGEPYKRGRWTCRDFYESEAETHLLTPGRLADLTRHPHSLDSRLEVTGLLLPKPAAGPFSPQPPRRGAAPHGPLLLLPPGPAGASPGHQARSLGGGGGLPALFRPHQIPPSAGALRSPLAAPSGDPPPISGAVPVLVVGEPPGLPKSVAQLIQREAAAAEEPRHKVASPSAASPRQPRSRPSSPAAAAAPLFRDASPSRKTSDPFGAARLSLAQSMFGMGVGGAHDGEEDSGTNSSMIAIDNKIEQAMDLVKSHLMFAVREEVEVLREQIKELSERNALLEQENALLRSLANADQLSSFQAQLHTTKPSLSGD